MSEFTHHLSCKQKQDVMCGLISADVNSKWYQWMQKFNIFSPGEITTNIPSVSPTHYASWTQTVPTAILYCFCNSIAQFCTHPCFPEVSILLNRFLNHIVMSNIIPVSVMFTKFLFSEWGINIPHWVVRRWSRWIAGVKCRALTAKVICGLNNKSTLSVVSFKSCLALQISAEFSALNQDHNLL